MASRFELTLRAIPVQHLPSPDLILDAADSLISDSETWKAGKTYVNGKVQIYPHKIPIGGPSWWCRVSTHGPEEGGFDEMWNGLGVNHTLNEIEYIPEVKRATLLKKVDSGEIWTAYYTFSRPISPRYFTILVFTYLTPSSEGNRTGYIVTIPVNISKDPELAAKEEKGVYARYVSVETIREIGNGKVEWRMVTMSNPGGLVPLFVAEAAMGSKISQDVPHFLKWLKTKKGKKSASNGEAIDESKAVEQQPTQVEAHSEADKQPIPEVDKFKREGPAKSVEQPKQGEHVTEEKTEPEQPPKGEAASEPDNPSKLKNDQKPEEPLKAVDEPKLEEQVKEGEPVLEQHPEIKEEPKSENIGQEEQPKVDEEVTVDGGEQPEAEKTEEEENKLGLEEMKPEESVST